jgi:excisionase family DNA binding protein
MTTAVSDRQPLAEPPELAAYLNVPERTIGQWRRARKGPKWVLVGKHVRYRWGDVDSWLASQEGQRNRGASRDDGKTLLP